MFCRGPGSDASYFYMYFLFSLSCIGLPEAELLSGCFCWRNKGPLWLTHLPDAVQHVSPYLYCTTEDFKISRLQQNPFFSIKWPFSWEGLFVSPFFLYFVRKRRLMAYKIRVCRRDITSNILWANQWIVITRDTYIMPLETTYSWISCFQSIHTNMAATRTSDFEAKLATPNIRSR
jgi:hypothetical protein